MSNVTHIESTEITIRAARAEDMGELARVAGRDTHELPEGTLLVAKVGSGRSCCHLPRPTARSSPTRSTARLSWSRC